MGRGARKTGTKALGIYLVEPKYFDGHKSKVTSGKRKRGKASDGRRGQMLKKAKSNRSTADIIELDTSDGKSDSEEEGETQNAEDTGQPNAMDLTRPGQSDLPDDPDTPQPAFASTSRGASTTSGSTVLAPRISGMSDEEYEFSVMDTYINARSHNICRRKVCDVLGNKHSHLANSLL